MSTSKSINYLAPVSAIPGDFISEGTFDQHSVEMLDDTYKAVNKTPKGWATLAREDVPGIRDCLYCGVETSRRPTCNICAGKGTVERGFMFDSHPDPSVKGIISTIEKNMQYGGHSGSSYGWCMRSVEAIAKRGWETYILRSRLSMLGDQIKDPLVSQNEKDELLTTRSKLDQMIHQAEAKHRTKPFYDLVKSAAALDSFMSTTSPAVLTDLNLFADAIQNNPGMRAQIPDIDEQSDALRRFAAGKMSYAEMRSLCG